MSAPEHLVEQYKAFMEDIGRIGERYESSKNFYVSILSALIAFLALANGDKEGFHLTTRFLVVVSLVGVGICILWIAHTRSVEALFRIKFRILAELETQAALYPAFKLESQWLFQPGSRPEGLQTLKYVRVTRINIGVAGLFIFLFVLLPFL